MCLMIIYKKKKCAAKEVDSIEAKRKERRKWRDNQSQCQLKMMFSISWNTNASENVINKCIICHSKYIKKTQIICK